MKNIQLLLIAGLVVLAYSFCYKGRNVINVLANANDELLFEGEKLALTDLTDTLKVILSNTSNEIEFPEMKVKDLPYLGPTKVSKAIVSIACDRGTSYKFYIHVQNEIERAYNELRDERSIAQFNKPYRLLSPEKEKAINAIYPKRISEAEPRVFLE